MLKIGKVKTEKMKYQEIKIGETYLYNNKEYKVLYKHDETQSIFTLNEVSGVASAWADYEFKDFKPKVKPIPKTGLFRGSKGSLIYRTGETSGYGFDSYGKFRDSVICIFDNDWKEATREDYSEFKELVIQHLKGLGFNDGDSFYSIISGDICTINFDARNSLGLTGIYLGVKYVYSKNEWIQPISAQNKLKKEIETRIKELEQTIQQLKKDIKE